MALENIYFSSIDVVRDNSNIHENVEGSIIKVSMLRTQDLYFESVLGTPLFKKILADIKANTLTGDYETLMDSYILPMYFAYVEYMVIPHVLTQIRNKTVGTSNDSDIQSTSEDGMNYLREKALIVAKKYETRLYNYLCDDAGVMFPEFTQAITDLEEVKPQSGMTGSFGYVNGL